MRITRQKTWGIICLGAVIFTLLGVSVALAAKRSGVVEGEKAHSFQIKTAKGMVKFPEDFKGKIVLLDFWATWCPPCRKEIPSIVAAYEKYHTNGFEIIGISLDRGADKTAFLKFVKDNKMPWLHVYDGRYMQAALAVKYGVKSIPCPILVDGDTGIILAESTNVLGKKLAYQIEKGLAAKAKK